MNKILFLIAFDYLILTFKVKKYQIFPGNLIFLIVTAEDSGTLLFPIGYR